MIKLISTKVICNRKFHNISYELLKEDEKSLKGLRDVFFGSFTGTYKDKIIEKTNLEPLSSRLSLTSIKEFIHYATECAVEDQLSFIAKHQGEVVSFVLNKDYTKHLGCRPEFSEIFERDRDWNAIIEIFRKVDEQTIQKYDPKEGQFFHLWCGGTVVNNFYRKMGLFTKLIELSLEKAKEKRFQYAIAEVSSNSTQKILSGIGFRIEKEIKYESFEYPENEYPFRGKNFQNQSIFCMMKKL